MTRRQLLHRIEAAEGHLDHAEHELEHLGAYRDRFAVRNAEARLEETKLWVAHIHALVTSEPSLDDGGLIPVVKD